MYIELKRCANNIDINANEENFYTNIELKDGWAIMEHNIIKVYKKHKEIID